MAAADTNPGPDTYEHRLEGLQGKIYQARTDLSANLFTDTSTAACYCYREEDRAEFKSMRAEFEEVRGAMNTILSSVGHKPVPAGEQLAHVPRIEAVARAAEKSRRQRGELLSEREREQWMELWERKKALVALRGTLRARAKTREGTLLRRWREVLSGAARELQEEMERVLPASRSRSGSGGRGGGRRRGRLQVRELTAQGTKTLQEVAPMLASIADCLAKLKGTEAKEEVNGYLTGLVQALKHKLTGIFLSEAEGMEDGELVVIKNTFQVLHSISGSLAMYEETKALGREVAMFVTNILDGASAEAKLYFVIG